MYMIAASFEPRAFLFYAFVFLWQFLFMRCVLIGGVRTEWRTYPIRERWKAEDSSDLPKGNISQVRGGGLLSPKGKIAMAMEELFKLPKMP